MSMSMYTPTNPTTPTKSTAVLVIDDDADTRATLRLPLEDEGYAVIEAADGDGALAVLRTSPHGLVVVFDYKMPCTDGEALLVLAERERWLATTTRSSA